MQKDKKDRSFSGFSHFLNHQFIHKAKKPWVVFNFPKVMTKKQKNSRKTKKTNMSLRPNILWKVLVFWFSRGVFLVLVLVFPMASLLKSRQIADLSNSFFLLLLVFLKFFECLSHKCKKLAFYPGFRHVEAIKHRNLQRFDFLWIKITSPWTALL